jgi:hypothetical protein
MATNEDWSGRVDLNHRPPGPEQPRPSQIRRIDGICLCIPSAYLGHVGYKVRSDLMRQSRPTLGR